MRIVSCYDIISRNPHNIIIHYLTKKIDLYAFKSIRQRFSSFKWYNKRNRIQLKIQSLILYHFNARHSSEILLHSHSRKNWHSEFPYARNDIFGMNTIDIPIPIWEWENNRRKPFVTKRFIELLSHNILFNTSTKNPTVIIFVSTKYEA